MTGRCIHCLAPVIPPAEVCEACLELIADIGADDYVEPPPRPAPVNHTGRFEPTPEDWEAYRELSERGAFRPLSEIRPKQLPHHATNRWGRAVSAAKKRQGDNR